MNTGTAVNCKEEGHCLHPGTAVGSLYCCKCGQYFYDAITYDLTPIQKELMYQGLRDIEEGRYRKLR